MAVIEVGEGFTPKPAGKYPATIRDVELVSVEGGRRMSCKWVFAYEDDPDAEQWGWSSAEFKPRNKSGRWAAAAGHRLQPGEQFDTDNLCGERVLIEVSIEERGGVDANRVEDVLPADGGTDSAVAQEQAAGGWTPEAEGAPGEHVALTVEGWVDTFANAESVEDLERYVPIIQSLPADLRAQLRGPFAEAKRRLTDEDVPW